MNHPVRMQLIGKITYYAGWITLVSGGLAHFNITRTLFLAVNLSKRNLFEASVVCFLICIASELRGQVLPAKELPSALQKAA